MKRRPVVGGVVSDPKPPISAKCNVLTESVGAQRGPMTVTLLRHSEITVVEPGTTVPVVSTPTGVRTVWLESRGMSHPFNASELPIYTPIRVCGGEACPEPGTH